MPEGDTVDGCLGPDLLGPDWNADEALRRLTIDTGRAVGESVMQRRDIYWCPRCLHRSTLTCALGEHT